MSGRRRTGYPERGGADADDRPFPDEEVVDLGSGRMYPRTVWDRDELPNGEALPDDTRLAVRVFRGKIMLMTKGSIWNGSRVTYDGRHARMEASDIRSVIERSNRAA